jgi:hypothetical protein
MNNDIIKKLFRSKTDIFFIEIWPKIFFEAARTSDNIRTIHYSVPKRGIQGVYSTYSCTVHTPEYLRVKKCNLAGQALVLILMWFLYYELVRGHLAKIKCIPLPSAYI